uniref:uncharacterized protein LOC120337916 n=1 Tax=Styela clava TaxID=7725 RepID=UPI00193AAB2B|nr:uncharacterized protein LOC120337916 [Styela clava]
MSGRFHVQIFEANCDSTLIKFGYYSMGLISLLMHQLNASKPIIKIGGKSVDIKIGKEQGIPINHDVLLWRISDSWIELEASNSKKITSRKKLFCKYVRIHMVNNRLALYVTCDKGNVKFANINGNYTLSNLNVNKFENGSRRNILKDIVISCSLSAKEKSGFFYNKENGDVESRTLTFAGNSLRIHAQHQGLETKKKGGYILVNSGKIENYVKSRNNDGITYEMYVKKESDGNFFSYHSGSDKGGKFDLSFDASIIKIRINGQNWTETGILKDEASSDWIMLSINCKDVGKYIWFYYTTRTGIVYESNIFTGIDCFTPSGYITIGGGSEDTNQTPSNDLIGFSGTIDEIRIWDRVLTKFQTLQNFGINFGGNSIQDDQNSYKPNLLSLWNFDEGHGDIIHNLIPGGPDIHIKTENSEFLKQDRIISWTTSNAPVIPLCQQFSDSCEFNSLLDFTYFSYADDTQTSWAKKACQIHLENLFQNKVCKEGLGNNQDIILLQCIEDVLRANSTAEVDTAKSAYASLCRFTLDLDDPCMSSPCQHDGICESVVGTEYICDCMCGYTGKNCEIDINECENNPCTNGGICVNQICNFRCECPQGYVGDICQKKCITPLGLESHFISDSQITASSEYQSGMPWYISYLATRGRLNQRGWGGSWVPRDDDKNPWLQIMFLDSMRITGISIQGANWNRYNSWTTEFSISTSKDGNKWNKHDEIYEGNTNAMKSSKIIFKQYVEGCYFRIHPKKYHIRPAVRIELYGCSSCDCCNELGMESFYIHDDQITASSVHGLNCDRCSSYTAAWPRFGRLDGPRNKYADFNLWMADKNDLEPWITVDLLIEQYINGIIVQGGNYYRYPVYTELFQVKYSLDNIVWKTIEEAFEGNHDSTSHKRIIFDDLYKVRFVKVVLLDWKNHPGIRFELLGCSIDEVY